MKNCFFILFLFFLAKAQAQQVQISGTVYDEQSGFVIYGAKIKFKNDSVSSNAYGQFTLLSNSGKALSYNISAPHHIKHVGKIIATHDTIIHFFLRSDTVALDEVIVQTQKENSFGISRLNNVEGTTIYAGKKSEAVYLQDLNANLASNNSRQIFSKIPGINIFENEGSGATVGIGGRGLNPNRISNFNTRQNGYDISADALGYPESYYTPPTEAVERIEILRGAASLQFGTQFGGMINYRFTEPLAGKKISGNFRQTTGSFGFFNSFNQVTGTEKKLSYNFFYQFKHYDGWRSRSQMNSHNPFFSLKYKFTEKLFVKVEYTYLDYTAQQPGGLTDKQFNIDATQVTRQRNWFKVNWNLMSAVLDYKINSRTHINVLAFGLVAGRDALGNLGRIDRADDTTTNRNLLSDRYKNAGMELRLLHRYNIANKNHHFLVGARIYRGQTVRQQGDADKTNRADFEFLHPNNLENSSYIFPSYNAALFTENIFQLSRRWSVTPGLRFEYIKTSSMGYYRIINRDLSLDTILDKKISDDRSSERHFLLGGIGTQYKLNKSLELYCNWSQNYRSINFNDMRVVNPNFQVDPNLKDENGYTADGGFRGSIKDLLYFDLGVFHLRYNQRIGTTLVLDTNTYQLIRSRTNIGSSRSTGVEAFAELDWLKLFKKSSIQKLSTFLNFSYINAIYTTELKAYKNKKVEYVPNIIFRTGINYAWKKLAFTLQYSYTAQQFSDATNAIYSPAAIYGIIPAYSVTDLSVSYSWKIFGINAGINNLSNSLYFTRRAEGYPGPGILPADPRNFYLTLRLKV